MQRQSNNFRPQFTDEECITVYLWGISQRRFEQKAIYNYTKNHLSEWFPKLPRYQAFSRRCAALAPAFRALAERWMEQAAPSGETQTIYMVDSCPIMLAHRSPRRRTSALSSKKSSELRSIPYMSLDLTPGAGNLLGQFYWEILSPWRGAALMLNTGVSPREEHESFLWQILEDKPHPKYYLTRRACLGILRRASERGKPLPVALRTALEFQAGLREDVPQTKGKTAFTANQRDEVRDLHDVAGALGAQPGMKQQTFIAESKPILCLNDQGGQVMNCSVNITGTLRAQERGHQPLVFENHGIDSRYTGPHEVSPAISARCDIGGNNVPLMEQDASVYCIVGNIIDRQPENGGNGCGYQEGVSYTLTAMDRHAVFSRQRLDAYVENEVACTESARQHKDATDLVMQPYQETVGTLVRSDHKGISNQYVNDDKCVVDSPNLIRRLTPLECERLQGFPDGWTNIPGASDSARYKALGNSVAIPCVEYVMRGIAFVLRSERRRQSGNFEGKSIPNRIRSFEAGWGWNDPRLKRLYDYRMNRTELHKDDKILLSWNAWAMMALAKAGQVLEEPSYLDAAIHIHDLIESKMVDENDRLYLRYRDGEAAYAGQLDDYAVYALALLELYRVTFDAKYLQSAIHRAGQMVELFADREQGGYFMTASDGEQLIARPKETYDGAMPSGNSVAAMVLQTLASLTGELKWQAAADRQLRFLAGEIGEYPSASCFGVLAMMGALYPHRELVCATSQELSSGLKEYLKEHPADDLYVLLKTKENAEALAACAPFTKDYPIPEWGTMYFLCENGACKAPVLDFSQLNL